MLNTPAMPISHTRPLRYLTRMRVIWQQHWPWLLIVTGSCWLAVSIRLAPLNDWLTAHAQLQQATGAVAGTSPVDEFMKGWNTQGRGEPTPDGTGILLFWQLTIALYLPIGLILRGTGYYIYWHFARNTLFNGQLRFRIAFFAAVGGIWFIWYSLASTILYASPDSSRAGFDATLPTLSVALWMIQILVMHVLVRQREDRQLVQTTREAELAALTAQVNPPFIFNALHYLKAAAQTEQLPRTEQSLAQLAGIMQYVLEESRKHLTDVSREIDFIRDYLRLQELRLPQRNTIQISTDVSWDGKSAPIAPLLLNPLIENAFKYGISIQQSCFVRIRLHVADGILTFTSENSILPRTDLEKGTGLGLANVRKRLQLAYPGLHKLTVTATPGVYTVTLQIKLC